MAIKGKPHFEKKIMDMAVGEKGYILPWALVFDDNGRAFLNIKYPITKSSGGTSSMPIKRTGSGKNDYEIDFEFSYFGDHYSWSKSSDPAMGYMGNFEEDFVLMSSEEAIASDGIDSVDDKTLPDDFKGKQYFEIDKDKYPKTYKARIELNIALAKEDYKSASKLRDYINKSDEPL